MNRLRASLLSRSLLALAAAYGLLCAVDALAQASPPPGKALIVLYRADKQAVAARVPLIANADRLGDIGNGESVHATVNPGRTFLRAGDRILTTLAMQTSANQTYYVLIEAVPGLSPVRVEMREMTEAAARRALAQSRPAAAVAAAPAAVVPPRPVAPAVPAAPVPAPRAVVPPVAAAAAAPRPVPAPAAPAPAPRPQASAPPPPRPAPQQRFVREAGADDEEEEEHTWNLALIVKTGAFKLGTPDQTIGTTPSTFEKSSKPVAGFEAEFRHRSGFALGGEFLYYKNKVTAVAGSFTGDQTVLGAMLNAKYYFGDGDTFHPFIGGGAGFASASYGGDLTGKAAGPAFQGMAGVDLRFGGWGLYLEYKVLNATVSDNGSQKIKVGGSGILAGVSIAF